MILNFGLVPVFGGVTALCLVFGLSPSLASDNCAGYGPGFTSVEGSDTCIRIGGRVRVEAGTRVSSSSPNTGWASGSARPASLHAGADDSRLSDPGDFSRSHLRLPQGALGYADPR
jgi:hypothetical protein